MSTATSKRSMHSKNNTKSLFGLVTMIKTFLENIIVNQYNIFYFNENNLEPITNIPKLKEWGTVNKLYYEKDGSIFFNTNKLNVLQKKYNIQINIYKTDVTTYVSPVDIILDNIQTFEYKMDIVYNNQIVISKTIDSSIYQMTNENEIKSDMFKTFNLFAEKYVFMILFMISN